MKRQVTVVFCAAATVATIMSAAGCATSSSSAPPSVTLGTEPAFGGASNAANSSTSALPPKDQAAAEANAAVDRYMSVYNAVTTGREPNPDKLAAVAGDPLLQGARGDIIVRRSKGVTSSGDLKIVASKVVRNDLPSSQPGQADVEIDTCVDQSDYKSVRSDGKSDLVPQERVKRQWWVRNPSWPGGEWKVVGQSAARTAPCDV